MSNPVSFRLIKSNIAIAKITNFTFLTIGAGFLAPIMGIRHIVIGFSKEKKEISDNILSRFFSPFNKNLDKTPDNINRYSEILIGTIEIIPIVGICAMWVEGVIELRNRGMFYSSQVLQTEDATPLLKI